MKRGFLFLGVAGFAVVVYLGIYNLEFPPMAQTLHQNNTEQIGMALYSKYIIPFELTSVVLLVALIGAIVLAKKDDEKEVGSMSSIPTSAYLGTGINPFLHRPIRGINKTQHSDCLNLYRTYAECSEHQPCCI